MKTSIRFLFLTTGMFFALNRVWAVIDFDPAPDPAENSPPPPPAPSTSPAPSDKPAAPPTFSYSPSSPSSPSSSPGAKTGQERRFYFFSKLGLTEEQKAQLKIIAGSNQDPRDKRKQMMEVLTPEQREHLRELVDTWKANHPGSPGGGQGNTQQ